MNQEFERKKLLLEITNLVHAHSKIILADRKNYHTRLNRLWKLAQVINYKVKVAESADIEDIRSAIVSFKNYIRNI